MSRIMGNPNEIRVVNIRMVREPSLYSETPVSTPQDVMKVIAREMATYDREVFGILNLKNNGQVINMNICSIGTLNASLVSTRETMKSAVLSNAAAFIVFHQHPSGNPEPSEEDKVVKDTFKEFISNSHVDKYSKSKSGSGYISLTKKPLVPSAEEISRNNRSKPSILRALERI